jgi:phosphoglycolate phosphatase
MTPEAAVFDLDGTLLDTLEDLADSANEALETLGYPAHPTQSYRYFVGNGMEILIQRILPEKARTPSGLARGIEAMRDAYQRRWDNKTRPYAGVPELLDALAAAGLPLAILSNKPDDFTQLTVERLLARWDFAFVRGVRADTPPKPDPAGALDLARRLHVDPAACLYLGDTATDMQTANAAGMYALGAVWGFRTATELQEAGARALLETPLEMLPYANLPPTDENE